MAQRIKLGDDTVNPALNVVAKKKNGFSAENGKFHSFFFHFKKLRNYLGWFFLSGGILFLIISRSF